MKKILPFIICLVVCVLILDCANRGNPTGGEKDSTPPQITKSIPENFSTDFKVREIKITFDEYIKIKNLQKNLIISPPMDPEPQITPLGSASKSITIKILDTLKANTTYAFNFGESIVDNNEENPFSFYKYVFSTGSFIDSLTVEGSISDALNRMPEEFVTVMLYEVDSAYTDSVVFNRKPEYVTNTLDSTATFRLENLRPGTYRLLALKDDNSNFMFEQKTDKIGFVEDFITVPTTENYNIELFTENINLKALRPRLAGHQKIAFGFEGNPEELNIRLLSTTSDEFQTVITRDQKADTLYYWFKPAVELDSLQFEVSGPAKIDTFIVRLKDQMKDTLVVSPHRRKITAYEDPYEIEANLPLSNFDKTLARLIDKDSVEIDFTNSKDSLRNILRFHFNKTESNIYRLQLLPGAITDFFGNQNDTLSYSVRTKALSDYGNVRLFVRNAIYPIIVQLVNDTDVVAEKYATTQDPIDFTNLNPGKYYIRVIFDANGNMKYDPGNYLLKRQSERVSYFPEQIEVRASWNFIEEFTLQE
ncbi:MAG: hypothetical protein HKN00_02020 [Flavobacteriaceae bacterium]|nr:Ig-like domain-containing protein [Bacteroidia bacterium]MBT8287712.1 Ig-like domain-containing protein [Bacteroidia bacterium]NNF73931.1 hypothetical protein [Flavobacteriaceae bacterium]NNK72354.1 hypothetical protein [Flavobacteriaceae bacterium]